MVLSTLYGTQHLVWYSAPYKVLSTLYGTQHLEWYSAPCTVLSTLYGTQHLIRYSAPLWYSAPYKVLSTLHGTQHLVWYSAPCTWLGTKYQACQACRSVACVECIISTTPHRVAQSSVYALLSGLAARQHMKFLRSSALSWIAAEEGRTNCRILQRSPSN